MSHHLITGGAGFIGSALARRLLWEGHRVTVLDRFSRGKGSRVPKGAATIEADIRDPLHVTRAVHLADVVWHLAYVQGTQTFYADPKDVISVALRGIMNVLDACETSRRDTELILVSSSEVYQNPPTGMYPTDETVPLSVPDVTNPRYSYGGGKIASELAALAYAQAGCMKRTMIVRPHNIYGPDMGHEHVIPEFAARMAPLSRFGVQDFQIQGSGEETRSFCHISDCVDGLMILFERGVDRGVYHLGNPAEEHTILRLANLVSLWFGVNIRIVPGELPKGSPKRRAPDIGRLRELGFEPEISLERGLEDTLPWYAEHSKAAA